MTARLRGIPFAIDTCTAMEPPSALPEKRVRKRSKRLSETDSVSGEVEPARKRVKRGSESSGKKVEEVEPKRRRTRGSASKVVKCAKLPLK